ncbi:MAG: hypothetical protein KC486_27035, partial [Myxococcales bacterium]|nr:hypothetical protein [Myxococcales bacterium]
MVEPEVDPSSERDEGIRVPCTVLIYATHTALEGLDENGEVVSPRTPDERIDWLLEQLGSRCLKRRPGGTTYVVEYARRPSIRERLLRVQPGERYVLRDGSREVERIDEPLSDLASFLVWGMARGEADRYALVVLGDVLDVEEFEDAATRALGGSARALTSLIGPTIPSRGLTKSLPDKGSRPLREGLSDKGSRPLTEGLSDKGSRQLSGGRSDRGSGSL